MASEPKKIKKSPTRTATKIFKFPLPPLGGFFDRSFIFFDMQRSLQKEFHDLRVSYTKTDHIFNKKAYADTDAGKETVKKHCFRDTCGLFDAVKPLHMHVKPPLGKAWRQCHYFGSPVAFRPPPKAAHRKVEKVKKQENSVQDQFSSETPCFAAPNHKHITKQTSFAYNPYTLHIPPWQRKTALRIILPENNF